MGYYLNQRGFTLLEMLVVLIISSFVSVLLMQGLGFILQLQGRFVEQLEDLQEGALQEYWFRSTVSSTLADYKDIEPNHVFQGDSTHFSGLTVAGLDADAGVPTEFSWTLNHVADTVVLQYQQTSNEVAWQVAQWQGNEGEFRYLTRDGQWFEQWPPKTLGVEAPQLPRAILLSGKRRQQSFAWIVPLLAKDQTPIDYRLLEDNSE